LWLLAAPLLKSKGGCDFMSALAVRQVLCTDNSVYERLGKVFEEKHKKFMYIAGRYLGRENAEDAVQEAFVRAISKSFQYREEASLYTWVTRILINFCFEQFRGSAQKRNLSSKEFVPTDLDELSQGSEDTEDTVIKSIDYHMYLSMMKKNHRIAVLSSLHGMSGTNNSKNKALRRRGYIEVCEKIGIAYRSSSR
jgi:RNA polymerase sigma factor (sigma-70 family)